MEEPFRRLEKLYISTCMLTMHPLNILNMWPIIYKLIVAGAGPVHSCMCNRLLIQWQTFEILTMSSPQRQPKYAGSPTQQAEILHLPCLLTCFKISPIALFNRVASLNIPLNSIVQTNMFQWHMHIIRMIMQYKPVKKTGKKSTFLHEQHYLKSERWYHRYQ